MLLLFAPLYKHLGLALPEELAEEGQPGSQPEPSGSKPPGSTHGSGSAESDDEFGLGALTGETDNKPKREQKGAAPPEGPPEPQGGRETGRRAPTVPEPKKRAKMALPKAYDGKNKGLEARQFWNKCEAYIRHHDDLYNDDDDKMDWIFGLMEGTAYDWATPLQEKMNIGAIDPRIASLTSLKNAFLTAFGDPDAHRSPVDKLSKIKQGTKAATDLNTEFDNLVADVPDYNDQTLRDIYCRAIRTELSNVLAMGREPRTLIALQQWVIKMDNQLRREGIYKAVKKTTPSSSGSGNTGGRATRSQTKDREEVERVPDPVKAYQRKEGLCIKCGKKGHQASDCRGGWKFTEEEARKAEESAKEKPKEDKNVTSPPLGVVTTTK